MSQAPSKLQKKICLLGSFAVGKTSLVRRFVKNIFSDAYKTTLGVKIDKKIVRHKACDVTLMVWDIAGEDEFHEVPMAYLVGASGYLLVLDGTRQSTWPVALALHEKVQGITGNIPFIMLANKADLEQEWELDEAALGQFTALGPVIRSSAKTGLGVEEAFHQLTELMLPETAHES